jgi:N-methylhydantoinase A
MHAVEVARLMDIRRVIVPQISGAFSAFGCLSADLSYTIHRTVRFGSGAWNAERLRMVREAMRDQVQKLIGPAEGDPKLSWVAAVRYVGQSYAVEISEAPLDAAEALGEKFKAKHLQLYGFATAEPWELTALRLTGSVPRGVLDFDRSSSDAARGASKKARDCVFNTAGAMRVPEYRRVDLPPGRQIVGPAIVADAMSTIVVPPKSSVEATQGGHLKIDVEPA